MSGLLKKILRAAVAQPWDYQGEGAPGDWEMRVSPGEDHFAVWDPGYGRWLVYTSARPDRIVTDVELAEMDKHTGDWRQFLSVEDPD